MKRILGILLASGVLATGLMAQPQSRIANRKQNQQTRIAEGVNSGELTAREAARLERKEAVLNRKIQKERMDGGGLTAKERVKIERRQDKLSREIAKEKHDRQGQPK
jgi:hypothetical protein